MVDIRKLLIPFRVFLWLSDSYCMFCIYFSEVYWDSPDKCFRFSSWFAVRSLNNWPFKRALYMLTANYQRFQLSYCVASASRCFFLCFLCTKYAQNYCPLPISADLMRRLHCCQQGECPPVWPQRHNWLQEVTGGLLVSAPIISKLLWRVCQFLILLQT